MVENLDVELLRRRLAAELLRRQPAVLADLVSGELPALQNDQQLGEPSQPDPNQQQPAKAPEPVAELPPPDPEVPEPVAEVPEPDPEAPLDGPPDWCNCGHCQVMPRQAENKCCCRRRSQCTSTLDLFQLIVLNGNVLDIAMRYREDVLALDHPRNNENVRHMAYRQFILWQHGRLGQGNRRVVPSCCVLANKGKISITKWNIHWIPSIKTVVFCL